MFHTLLIANRGEIACRIMRTARRLGIRTVAVFSDADAEALHVRQADVALRIGPAPPAASYLDVGALLEAARLSGAEAVHPGYGFLSENAPFAEACTAAGLAFVGPDADAIRAMGSKIDAKRLVADAGTAVVPGYQGDDQSDRQLAAEAQRIGYPVLIKASAGGGGKGMRRVDVASGFGPALAAARREAKAAFGDDRMLLERYLASPKHIEVQILADAHGNVLHLFERDCSVQRRHQKVIEEAPGPGVSPALREALGAAAIRVAGAVEYRGAGTVEFIVEGLGDGAARFYFMEMNTRLQVEHPVTEAITGIDLVEWQLRIAAGEALPLTQQDLTSRGHAVEARVYAENPRRGFLPSTGRLRRLAFGDGEGVRVDSGVAEGDAVSVHYDPMLAKVIAHGPDRATALARLDAALAATRIAGVEHNIAVLRRLLATGPFVDGDYSTDLVDDLGDALLPPVGPGSWVCAALGVQQRWRGDGRWGAADGFRLNLAHEFALTLTCGDDQQEVRVTSGSAVVGGVEMCLEALAVGDRTVRFRLDGQVVDAALHLDAADVYVMHGGDTLRFRQRQADVAALAGAAGAAGRIVAPMPGQVIAVAVEAGDEVTAGQVLLVIEAMKMEHAVAAPRDGVVATLACSVGDRVDDGVELVTLES